MWIPEHSSAQLLSGPPQISHPLLNKVSMNIFSVKCLSKKRELQRNQKTCSLTFTRLCVSYINEAIHHLAHLLHLRSRDVYGAAGVVGSIRDEQLITDALLLQPGSFSLRPADANSQL